MKNFKILGAICLASFAFNTVPAHAENGGKTFGGGWRLELDVAQILNSNTGRKFDCRKGVFIDNGEKVSSELLANCKRRSIAPSKVEKAKNPIK